MFNFCNLSRILLLILQLSSFCVLGRLIFVGIWYNGVGKLARFNLCSGMFWKNLIAHSGGMYLTIVEGV